MASPRSLDVNVEVRFNTHYPKVPSTMAERLEALKEVKALVTARDSGVSGVIFGNTPGVPANENGVLTMLRVAEYITTGHDYLDTHPMQEQVVKPSKKERRKRAKEIRKIVIEEVEEELDRRHKTGAGKLIMPEVVIERADGTQYPAFTNEEGKGDE